MMLKEIEAFQKNIEYSIERVSAVSLFDVLCINSDF